MITRFKGEYEFLSNFWFCHTVWQGETYPTLEHAFQAAKALDPVEQAHIRQQVTPGQAKYAGRKVTLRPDWDEVKVALMYDLLRQKFAPGTRLAGLLLATGNQLLVEGNHWHDNWWGICTCSKCGGRGKNVLGELLMHIRMELAKKQEFPLASTLIRLKEKWECFSDEVINA